VGGAVDGAVHDAVRVAVGGAVHDAVGVAVRDAVRVAVGGAVRDAVGVAVDGAVRDAVGVAVRDAVRVAVGGAVSGAVRDAVGVAVGGAVHDAVGVAVGGEKQIHHAVKDVICRSWANYIGGQFWPSGWYCGGAFMSFFREICSLELAGDLWERGLAYEDTIKSACWWYPHRDFVIVCERPVFIKLELANPARPHGIGSHRLHGDGGPAIVWPDGWGVYATHGVRVPPWIIEQPDAITVQLINKETNTEIRRIMIKLYGYAKYLSDGNFDLIEARETNDALVGLRDCKLWKSSDTVLLDMLNSTPEPDGSTKRYVLPVDPQAYNGRASRECLAAMASTWRKPSDPTQLYFASPEHYRPMVES